MNLSVNNSTFLGRSGAKLHNSAGISFAGDPNRLVYQPQTPVDGFISSLVFDGLELVFGLDIHRPSPMTINLPLVASPSPVVLSVLLYLLAVSLWCRHIRNNGLKPRVVEPLPLKVLISAHNLFLCGLSLYMGVGLIYEARKDNYSVWGNPYQDGNYKMAHYIHLFYVSKLYEFVDTLIMLLKRNTRQVSYLHVYHHASISIVWWIMCYRCPGGDSYFSAAFNSWIHVIMYSYYLLAAAIGKNDKLRRKYLFWGKYLTMLQMFQFVSFIGQSLYGMRHPGLYPSGVDTFLFAYSLSLLVFFVNFFVRKHLLPSSQTKGNEERKSGGAESSLSGLNHRKKDN